MSREYVDEREYSSGKLISKIPRINDEMETNIERGFGEMCHDRPEATRKQIRNSREKRRRKNHRGSHDCDRVVLFPRYHLIRWRRAASRGAPLFSNNNTECESIAKAHVEIFHLRDRILSSVRVIP